MKKYKYLKVIQFSCGHGWEDVDETEDAQNARYLHKEYAMAFRATGSVRCIDRRELNQ